MSKKLPKHHRLFKQLKVGLITYDDLSPEDLQLIRNHYPFLFK